MSILSRHIKKKAAHEPSDLIGMMGVLAFFSTVLAIGPASAAQPPAQLSFSEIAPDATLVARFDRGAQIEFNHRNDRTMASHGHIAMVSVSAAEPSAAFWPRREIKRLRLQAPAVLEVKPLPSTTSWLSHSAWGLAGAGASLVGGALEYREKSNALQRDYAALPDHVSAHRYREVQRQIDDTRYLMLALYAAGGTVIAQSIILLTDESNDPTEARAEIAPTWRNGGPAAYLKVSF
ncbi:hypothetical protein [Bradymonas sediminis]|uniref:Uncharacterized protein n=1 Tax=Bradymonas sediminis TaxID=1548548 RepID=A0A2Z4FHP1_9DELT|nr:hypothetical protein [Bradymonas sediminis]AWV88228.1 hypothetical protein DN745_02285 [Bradymonas sediminis]